MFSQSKMSRNTTFIYLSAAIVVVFAGRPFCEVPHDPEMWRLGVAEAVSRTVPEGLRRDGHVYEVGVFTGNSMVFLANALNPRMIWGLDSFQGLPESNVEEG